MSMGIYLSTQKSDAENIERVQKRATKLITVLSKKPHSERLKFLNSPILKYSRYRGDMIELYKMVKGIYDPACLPHFEFVELSDNLTKTTGDKYKLIQHLYKNLTKMVISTWNIWSDYVVSSNTVNTFKHRLDKYWCDQDVMYNYSADLHGTGNSAIALSY